MPEKTESPMSLKSTAELRVEKSSMENEINTKALNTYETAPSRTLDRFLFPPTAINR
jgi:hypothetical protein